MNFSFSDQMLNWFNDHGRKHLPWQQNINAYTTWVSEIMLQQTQVETVIPYYLRFVHAFPNITALAEAELEQVLALWAGLGYYARARNLHKAAQIIQRQYSGEFPQQIDQVVALPGIGRSTASAILVFSFNQRHSILDGNVKRVLTRFFAIDGNPSTKKVENELWDKAQRLTPDSQVANYTQAIMDLGATICTRTKPLCRACPVLRHCKAYAMCRQHEFPTPKPKAKKPLRKTCMLLLKNQNNQFLLVKRPPTGIWGGLWCLPQLDNTINPLKWLHNEFGLNASINTKLNPIRHSFTHFNLEIESVVCTLEPHSLFAFPKEKAPEQQIWYQPDNPEQVQVIGLPSAIKKVFALLKNDG